MVAESTLITITIISAEGLYSSVFFIFFQQKGSIIDKGLLNGIEQHSAYEDMVDALPETLVTIGGFRTMRAFYSSSDIMQTVVFQIT